MKNKLISKLRISLVGFGASAKEYHLPAIRYVKAPLSCVVDTNEENLRFISSHFPDVTTSTSHADITPENTDLCIVTTPPDSHFSIVSELLARGVNVLVEKPVVPNGIDCDTLLAMENRARCYAAQVRRFFPAIEYLKKIVDAEIYGELREITISEGGPFVWETSSGYLVNPNDEGVLTDTGAHTLDILHYLIDGSSDLYITSSCLMDRYPQTNTLEASGVGGSNNVGWTVKVSRQVKVASKLVLHFDNVVLQTKPIFTQAPLKATSQKNGFSTNLELPFQKMNVRYAFVKQLESVLEDILSTVSTTTPVRLSRVRGTVALFDSLRNASEVSEFNWGFL